MAEPWTMQEYCLPISGEWPGSCPTHYKLAKLVNVRNHDPLQFLPCHMPIEIQPTMAANRNQTCLESQKIRREEKRLAHYFHEPITPRAALEA